MKRFGSFRTASIGRSACFVGLGTAIVSGDHHDLWPVAVAAAFAFGMRERKRRSAAAGVVAATSRAPWTSPEPLRPATPARPRDAGADARHAPPRRQPGPVARSQSGQIAARLDGLVERIAKLVSDDVLSLVKSIVTTIEEILPMLEGDHIAVGDADAFTIRQTALHYLPDTMAAYFRLPPSYRTSQPLDDGKTARVILIEQLTVLDSKMREVARNLAASDTQALLANGYFLRERFATGTFTTV